MKMPHCWKSRVAAHLCHLSVLQLYIFLLRNRNETCGSFSSQTYLLGYVQRLSVMWRDNTCLQGLRPGMLKEVYVFFNKISQSHILLIKTWTSFITVCFAAITLVIVNMFSVTSASRYITSASRYHPRYQSRSMMYIIGLIPRNFAESAEALGYDWSLWSVYVDAQARAFAIRLQQNWFPYSLAHTSNQVKDKVSVTRKCHSHRPQTNPLHRAWGSTQLK